VVLTFFKQIGRLLV